MIRLFNGWRPRRRPGPPTLIGVGVDWPTDTQVGDLAMLVVETTTAFYPPPGWTLVEQTATLRVYSRIVGFFRRALHLPGPARAQLLVFRNATL